MKQIKRSLLFVVMMLIASASVMAALEITQDANKLNYWVSGSHIVTVANTATSATTATVVSPWTVTATDGVFCTNVVNTITCVLTNGTSGTYTVTSDASVGEYATTSFTGTTNNNYTVETVKFIRLQDDELFKTLVEYGRGRGNYFFDSSTMRTKGEQCTDLPALTDIELNYLHKVYPVINNYLNIPGAEGTNVSIECQYPNQSVIKQHLATNIAIAGGFINVNYSSDWLKTSWEKVFFLVQDFDNTEKAVGSTIDITCNNMQYYLADANGWVTATNDSFTLTFRNSTPLSMTAVSNPTSIGTGTSEVEITYTITNNENIVLSSSTEPLSIDIKAPPQAVFIGTRGELFGTALESYRYELNSMGPLESVNVTLFARFDTDGTTPLALSGGASIAFVPCWQVNAYNPLSTEQIVNATGTITVTGAAVAINGVPSQLDNITASLVLLNYKIDLLTNITININSTVNTIQNVVYQINTTTNNIQTTVNQINSTVNVINSTTTAINNYLLNQVTNYLSSINFTTQNTNVIVNQINSTANSIYIVVGGINSTVNAINTTVTQINSTVNNINTNTQTILTIVQYLNSTVWNNLTAQDIINAINNQTQINYTYFDNQFSDIDVAFAYVNTSFTNLFTDVRQLQEFQEESIYLITDSITEGQKSYAEALQAYDDGDTATALEKLQESVKSLTDANDAIDKIRNDPNLTEAQKETWVAALLDWVFAIFK